MKPIPPITKVLLRGTTRMSIGQQRYDR